MAITPPALVSIVWGKLVTAMPSAQLNWRLSSNPSVVPHNPMLEIITYCCTAWHLTLLATPVSNTYTGTAGGANVPTPTPIVFITAPAAAPNLIGLMAWMGPACIPFANALTTDIGLATASIAQYVPAPVPGGGQGTGAILPQNQVALTTLAGVFYGHLRAQFMSKGFFTVGDLMVVLTPQIDILLGVLSGLYSTMLSSVTTVTPIIYSGPTAPSAMVNPAAAGKIV
jgi:hypothetical protein